MEFFGSTYFNWKAKYGGMTASDIKRLRELEEENRQLKRMFADMGLENRALKDQKKSFLINGEVDKKTQNRLRLVQH